MDISVTPYLLLNGTANKAIVFYKRMFDAEVIGIEYLKDWPEEIAHDTIPREDQVIHGHLKIGHSELMLADSFADASPLSLFHRSH